MTLEPPAEDDPALYAVTVRDLDLQEAVGARILALFQHDKDAFTAGEDDIFIDFALDNGWVVRCFAPSILIEKPTGEHVRLGARREIDPPPDAETPEP